MVTVQGFDYLLIFTASILSLKTADGWIEVLSPDTAIVRIVPQKSEDDAFILAINAVIS
ncbi:hypothetical protein [Iningainema tapete]|uniref:hypothetical protein n=1 Tax=Iningainema tapete TaxID=2806730 RepID=UPI001EE2BF95|nr:hypothetical protein [Iningainema tapete]